MDDIKIVFGGDFSPQRTLLKENLFCQSIQSFLDDSDFRIINLETTICDGKTPRSKIGVHLNTSSENVPILKKSGVDFVTLANNHIFDFGPLGVEQTVNYLNENGILYAGIGKTPMQADQVYIQTIKGRKIGFLFYAEHEFNYQSDDCPCTAMLNPSRNVLKIRESAEKCDFLILFTHFGPEGWYSPSPRMVSLFHDFIEAGASAVLNTHAHRVMGMEYYKGCPIYYGLGNLFFSGIWESWGYEGMMVKLVFSGDIIKTEEIFTVFDKEKQVELAKDQERRKAEFEKISGIIQEPTLIESEWDKFCHSQKGHLAREVLKGALALLPYLFLKKIFKKKRWPGDRSYAAKGARMFRGFLLCENHVEVFGRIVKNLSEGR